MKKIDIEKILNVDECDAFDPPVGEGPVRPSLAYWINDNDIVDEITEN
jgi:hypothetical protein